MMAVESTITNFIGQLVNVTIDRPLGTRHPRHGFRYPVNYGFLPGIPGGDGEDLDAYILGVEVALTSFTGECIAVIHRLNDDDDKLVIVPPGMKFKDEEIRSKTDFQEQWFQSEILRKRGG